MKKVTLQDIAESLGVSRISVWKVFSGREGVSNELKRKVILKATELNYSFPKDFVIPEEYSHTSETLNISVVVSFPESSIFWTTMIHEVAKALSKENVNLIYTYLPDRITDDYTLPSQLTNGSMHGLIVLNVYDVRAIKMLSRLSTPKIFFDTSALIHFDELNGDLLLATGKTCIHKIVEYLVTHEKKKIGFIGDISISRTMRERYECVAAALSRHNLTLNPEYCCTRLTDTALWESKFLRLLEQKDQIPDAFLCCTDQIACNVFNLLKSKGFRIPEDIFISGFDGIQELSLANKITSVRLFMGDIGLRLATQILYKIKNPDLRNELIYISSDLIWGNRLPES